MKQKNYLKINIFIHIHIERLWDWQLVFCFFMIFNRIEWRIQSNKSIKTMKKKNKMFDWFKLENYYFVLFANHMYTHAHNWLKLLWNVTNEWMNEK